MPPCTGSNATADLPRDLVELRRTDRDAAARMRAFGEPLHQRIAVLSDLGGLLAEQPRHFSQHIRKGRTAVARGRRKIRATPDRLAVRRKEHRQRPAALFAEMMQRRHVNLVDVGALLAIDFDVDEQLIHHRRGRFVLETLVRHHVAPVAGGVSDREQDRLVRCVRPLPGLRCPTATTRPDCPCAAINTGWFPARGDFRCRIVQFERVFVSCAILRKCRGGATGVAEHPYFGV